MIIAIQLELAKKMVLSDDEISEKKKLKSCNDKHKPRLVAAARSLPSLARDQQAGRDDDRSALNKLIVIQLVYHQPLIQPVI